MRSSEKSEDTALGSMVTILNPKDAQQPILSPSVRGAIHQWMTEIRSEEELKRVKVEPRRSAILSGPPGCGKTTLAHHLAQRLNYQLVCVHMDRLRSKWVGQTGEQIADLFSFLNRQTDTIAFFDEFDALAAQRTDDSNGAGREANAIVNSLLQRIESYRGILIAATNRQAAIDPAIWRRFGMQLEIPIPGTEERFAIIKIYTEPFDIADDHIDLIAEATKGAPPSLLRQLIEGVKRDLVLAPRLNLPADAKSTFERVLASVSIHSSYETPELWTNKNCLAQIAKMPWPPTLKS